MSTALETVTVTILDKDYQVNCPADEVAELKASALFLDERMREIRQNGKVFGLERIAVMAGLNITHEMQKHKSNQTLSEKQAATITRIGQKVDQSLRLYQDSETS